MSIIEYVLWFVTGLCILFVIWVASVGLPCSIEAERQFVEACTQAGGVPGKYGAMIGKTSYGERLCIKKENIVEIGK